MRPPRICKYPGCSKLAHSGAYCERHQQQAAASECARKRGVDARRANSPVRRWYQSSRWKESRKRFLMFHQTCAVCGKPARVVDHVIPHQGREELFWSQDNWCPMCKSCHDRKTASRDGGFGNPVRPLGR